MGRQMERADRNRSVEKAEGTNLNLRYERYRGLLKNFTLMNDVFMRNVFKDRECTEYVLQVILEKKDLKVREQIIQKDYKNLQGRSAILDCVALDADERQYNIEIQQENEGASPKRARYHSGLMDMNTLCAGQDFDELPESYVIFITRDDTLGYGLPIYHIRRMIEENKEEFLDESHIIYVNSRVQDDTELGHLMHDLHCKNADEMHSGILARRVRELKETQKGVENMCREMDQIYKEGREEGREEGRAEGREEGEKRGRMETKRENAISMAELGLSIEQIAKVVKENVDLVQKWIAEGMTLAESVF